MGGEATMGPCWPTGGPERVGDGLFETFSNGTIFSSPATGAHVVPPGDILNTYLAHGGPEGALGFPTSDPFEVCGGAANTHGGWCVKFEHGYVRSINLGDGHFETYVTWNNMSPSPDLCPTK